MIYYVGKNGRDDATGTKESPFKTINRAAAVAVPGDVVRVCDGVYREWVDPQNGGLSDDLRIVYEAAPGEHPVIKGSEVVTDWEHVEQSVWKKVLPNSFFGDWNPFLQKVEGDWLEEPCTSHVHVGDVYLNGVSMYEALSEEELYEAHVRVTHFQNVLRFKTEYVLQPEKTIYRWYARVDEAYTTIFCNFQGENPNEALVEINVRKCCFYPRKSGLNFITVRGFEMAHAACPFTPPTGDQIGMLGPHWSKGWIIEDNHLHDAKCSAISIGRDGTCGNNLSSRFGRKSGHRYQLEAVFHGLRNGWCKELVGSHIIRNNTIHDCGQNGIVGHMGGAFSKIIHNHIYNIAVKREFWGHELGGIKLHAAVDAVIENNHIHHCSLGTWMDWQSQGVRVTRNLYHHNDRDFMIEVTHGPCLFDNNIFLSEFTLENWAQGTAYVHNLFAGVIRQKKVLDRSTPYHLPHSTQIAGCAPVYGGDDRLLNNIFLGIHNGMGDTPDTAGQFCSVYDPYCTPEEYPLNLRNTGEIHDVWTHVTAPQPVWIEGNAYAGFSKPFREEKNSIMTDSIQVDLEEHDGEWFLRMYIPKKIAEASLDTVTTKRLGMPRIVEERYENPDGTPVDFDCDFLCDCRSDKIIPGPFASLSAGENNYLVWRNNT